MKSSKLIQLLKVLDPQEFKQFNKYIQSPYFTNSENVLKLYNYIRPHYPAFESDKLERVKAFDHLYPTKKFNRPRLRNLLLKITKILESYLIHLECEGNDFEKKKRLTHIYRKRNLNAFFQQKTDELLQDLEQQPFRDATYYYDKYLLQSNVYFYTHSTARVKEVINSALENLDYFFAIERLKIGLEFKTREKIYADKFNYFEKNRFDFYPTNPNDTYHLFKKVIELIEQEDEKIYFEIKSIFKEVVDQLQQEDQQTILYCLLNFTFRHIAKKGIIFIREAFNLYQIGLSKKVFLTQYNAFPSLTFLNIVITGSSLKEFDRTNNFIVEYSPLLKDGDSTYLRLYAVANLNFHKGAYKEAVAVINANKFSETIIETQAKILLLRAYLELSLIDTAYTSIFNSQLKNYEKYLSRIDELDATKIKGFVNFIRILKKYNKVRLKSSITLKAINELKELLNTLSPINFKPWLQKKIDDMEIGK